MTGRAAKLPQVVLVCDDALLEARVRSSLQGVVDEIRCWPHLDDCRALSPEALAGRLLLIDLEHPASSGMGWLRAGRADAMLGQLPLVGLSQNPSQSMRAAAIDHGAVDLLSHDFEPRMLQAVVRVACQRLASLTSLTPRCDALTGLLTFDAFWEAACAEFKRCRDQRSSFALFTCAVRRLRSASDGYGYATGDEALRSAARHLAQKVGPEGLPFRRHGAALGWLAVAPTAAAIKAQTQQVAQFRHLLPPHPRHPAGMELALAVGAGCVGERRIERTELEQLWQAASTALVRAERQGDGAIVLLGPPDEVAPCASSAS
jgi:diguanylate cyclase (GGDEF)-like protein